MGNCTKIFLLVGMILVSACVKQSFDLEECLEDERIRIELQWVNTEPVNDDSVRIAITSSSGNVTNINSDHSGRDVNLAVGVYDFLGWEPAANVTVDNNTVSVGLNPDGTLMEPGRFNAGRTTAEVYANIDFQTIPLPMRQQTRELVVRVLFTGEGSPLLESVEGSVDGIAIKRDIDYGFRPVNGEGRNPAIENGNISYNYTQGSDGWFTGRRNLLGIDGDAVQNLTLHVGFLDGNFTTIELDVSPNMDEFHITDVREPWYIVLQVNLGANIDFTIEDWTAGSESWLTAQ